jgi:hypothetical protein
MGWIAYALGWLVAALLWTLAGASATGRPPWQLAGHGLLTMTPRAVLGVGVWRLTGRVYATSWMLPDVLSGRGAEALARLRGSSG